MRPTSVAWAVGCLGKVWEFWKCALWANMAKMAKMDLFLVSLFADLHSKLPEEILGDV